MYVTSYCAAFLTNTIFLYFFFFLSETTLEGNLSVLKHQLPLQAVSHANRGLNGRFSVHDTSCVSGWQRGVSEEEFGSSRVKHAV